MSRTRRYVEPYVDPETEYLDASLALKRKREEERAKQSQAYEAQLEADKESILEFGTADKEKIDKIRLLGDMSAKGLQAVAAADPGAAEAKIKDMESILGLGETGPKAEAAPYMRGTHVLPGGREIPFYTNLPEGQAGAGMPGQIEDLQPYDFGEAGPAPAPAKGPASRMIEERRAAVTFGPRYEGAATAEATKAVRGMRRWEKRGGQEGATEFLNELVGGGQISADAAKIAQAQREGERGGEREAAKIALLRKLEPGIAEKGALRTLDEIEEMILDPKQRQKIGVPALNAVRSEISKRARSRTSADIDDILGIRSGLYYPLEPTTDKQKVGGEAMPTESIVDTKEAEKNAIVEGLMQTTQEAPAPETTTTYNLAMGKTSRTKRTPITGEGGIRGLPIPGLEEIFSYNPEEWEAPSAPDIEPLRELLAGAAYAAGGREGPRTRQRRLEREKRRREGR